MEHRKKKTSGFIKCSFEAKNRVKKRFFLPFWIRIGIDNQEYKP